MPFKPAVITVENTAVLPSGVVAGTTQHLNQITGITQADPAVVTSAAHGLSDGDRISICGVDGMKEVNSQQGGAPYVHYKVAGQTTNTFELNDGDDANINSSGYTAYTRGGIISTPKSTGASNNCGGGQGCFITQNTRSGIISVLMNANIANEASATVDIRSTEIRDGDIAMIMVQGGDAAGLGFNYSTTAVLSADSLYEIASFTIVISNYTGDPVTSNPIVTIHWKVL